MSDFLLDSDFLDIVLKVALSAFLGGVVGAERERTGKWAGLRTHMLIAVGAALLTDISVSIGAEHAAGSTAWDPARIAAQIVSGIGFLGAGTIIQSRGHVRGLTTAAGLWVAAAVGMAVGAGFYVEGSVVALTLVLILAALKPVERLLVGGRRRTVLVRLGHESRLEELARLVDDSEAEPESIEVRRDGEESVAKVSFNASDASFQGFLAMAEKRDLRLEGDLDAERSRQDDGE